MSKINYSTRLLVGAIVSFAEADGSTVNATTKPTAEAAEWKEIGCVESLSHEEVTHEEEFDCPHPTRGWRSRKDKWVFGDRYMLRTRETSEIVHRLAEGVAAALALGTSQTALATSERKITGWIKMKLVQPGGKIRIEKDIYCDIRLAEEPASEKAVQVPVLELEVLDSTLNTVVMPDPAV